MIVELSMHIKWGKIFRYNNIKIRFYLIKIITHFCIVRSIVEISLKQNVLFDLD